MLSRHTCPLNRLLLSHCRESLIIDFYCYVEHFRSVVLNLSEVANPTSVMQTCVEPLVTTRSGSRIFCGSDVGYCSFELQGRLNIKYKDVRRTLCAICNDVVILIRC